MEKLTPTIRAVEPPKPKLQEQIKSSETAQAAALVRKTSDSTERIVKGQTFSIMA
jgi:hypothetical protein